ncbi:hypothetical protein BVX93_01360, partial [bacterium B13(2017)]
MIIKTLNLFIILILFSVLFKHQSAKNYSFSFKIFDKQLPESIDSSFLEEQIVTGNQVDCVHSVTACEIGKAKIRAFWYGGSREGAKDVAIYTSVFDPINKKWSKNIPIVTPKLTQNLLYRYIKKIGNPVIFKKQNGDLILFFVSVSFGGWAGSSINIIISSDDGETWSSPKRLISTPFFNISTLVKSIPFFYDDGTIGLPVYHEFIGKFCELLRINENGDVLYKKRLSKGDYSLSPVIIPLDSKTAVCFLRNHGPKYRNILYMKTDNGGYSWTKPVINQLPNHNSAFSCIRLQNNNLLMALNYSKKRRDNLAIALSKDSGISWKVLYYFEKEKSIMGGFKWEFAYPWV